MEESAPRQGRQLKEGGGAMRIARKATLAVAILFGAGALALTLSVATASASPSKYDFHAGDGFAGIASPDISSASNGDTVTIVATGSFHVAPGKASGGGTFVHKAASGTVLASGTFEVER